MILLIDNYDSFTYNLYQQIAALGKEVQVVRNDAISLDEIRTMQPEAIILSPGPGTPDDAGMTLEVIRELYQEFPILGICLGHQSIGQAFGASIVRAGQIMHGKFSTLSIHSREDLFANVSEAPQVMRYHSLVIDRATLPPSLIVTATASDDGEIMALRHRDYPLYGMQYHPESIGTGEGAAMVEAFLKRVSHVHI
ncbi:anthranilate synthase component II [Kurthia huakuii]|uniref:anthranilate synthase component II n=1 Tax=Kurthia huakuii TaxID=1421019 RepID=UPI00049632ED|nr:aminodeoxychorismate/anthranilate synthase component II [Kurthia huakuii]MBM7698230.1 anthranilate synthase component 2/anthranilate synthase/phosphoribosyltransferase [Kurthia huakuii]